MILYVSCMQQWSFSFSTSNFLSPCVQLILLITQVLLPTFHFWLSDFNSVSLDSRNLLSALISGTLEESFCPIFCSVAVPFSHPRPLQKVFNAKAKAKAIALRVKLSLHFWNYVTTSFACQTWRASTQPFCAATYIMTHARQLSRAWNEFWQKHWNLNTDGWDKC